MPDTETDPLRVAILGNVHPDIWWSTEWEYSDAWSRNGHIVHGYLEQDPQRWDDLIADVLADQYDLVQWTSTHDFAMRAGDSRQWELAAACRRTRTPLIGVHLDTWINLEREDRVHTVPYFRAVDMLYTADGDADDLWEREGVNHHWLPPGINERYCYLAEPDPAKYDCDIVFVGGWDNYGHKRWTHRAELIEHLTRWYGDRFLALPRRGQPRIVGDELNVIYATAKVVVGDSCLVPHPDGRPKRNYCSDRMPETLGRGGIFVHPSVDGIDKLFGCHFPWDLGDWGQLRDIVDSIVEAEDEAWAAGSEVAARQDNVDFIRENHSYTVRVRQIVAHMQEVGLL